MPAKEIAKQLNISETLVSERSADISRQILEAETHLDQ
jgi:hypothetical protein